MNNSSRVILNTGAQYMRTVINMCLSLISARIILSALGQFDYGIYSLIAGVISLLSFVINALVVTTQRYLSFYSGKNQPDKVKQVFANSVFIHVVLAFLCGLIFELIGNFLFNGFFNISPERIPAARIVYHIVTVNVMLGFITSPFRALLIANENIVFISFVDVIDGVLRLVIALIISASQSDRLIIYALLLGSVSLMNFIVYMVYDKFKYSECVFPRRKYLSLEVMKEMGGFAGWTVYSIFCITGRTQGVAIILNKFFSVVVNTAYGIGMQVNAAIAFLSQSVVNAINPQIMKAEGVGDRKKMLRLAEIESKMCFLLLSMFLVPCIFEMPALLDIWLGEVPQYSVYFCRGLLAVTLIDQLTIGLGAANQAIGKIKTYSLTVNTIKFLTIPVIVAILLISKNIYLVMYVYALFEFICAMVRLIFLKRTAGLSIVDFTRRVFVKELLPILVLLIYCWSVVSFLDFQFRFLYTLSTAPLLYVLVIYIFGLCSDEKKVVDGFISRFCSSFIPKKTQLITKFDMISGKYYPRLLASKRYKYCYGKRVDWKNPQDLNEKILWLEFYTDTTKWSELSDKYLVRNYVISKGYKDSLVELYGVWDCVDAIQWDSLPEQFILKMNNGSGDALICRDKKKLELHEVKIRFKELFDNRFGLLTAEPHYLRIKPRLIAEQLLDLSQQSIESTSLIDYKIWCFNGKPEFIFVAFNRTGNSLETICYDLNWNEHPEYSVFSDHYRRPHQKVPVPQNLDFMLKMATDLSQGFPQVRVDLYEVAGKVYFGELTFTSNSGLMTYFTPEWLRECGKKIKIS